MTACPIRYQRQVPDRKGKIFYTSITSLSHISKRCSLLVRHLPHYRQRRCDTAKAKHVRSAPETFKGLELSQQLPFVPKRRCLLV